MEKKSTRYVLLGLVNTKPMSGYDLHRKIQQHLSFFWHESFGQIYPTLKWLSAQGYVTCCKTDRTNGRDRQSYAITSKGRSYLRKWLAEPPKQIPVSDEFLLKIFLGRIAPPDSCCMHIRQHLARRRQSLTHYESIRNIYQTEQNGQQKRSFSLILVNYAITIQRAEIRWCESTLQTLCSGSEEQSKT